MAVRFGIRNYSRTGNAVEFTVVALNADGSIDTNYTGPVAFGQNGVTGLAGYTFTAGDAGSRTFQATYNGRGAALVTVRDPGNVVASALLSFHLDSGFTTFTSESGDNLFVGSTGPDSYSSNSATANDLFMLHLGGNDVASGGGGNDGFYFGGAYTNADTVNGGAGNLDQVGLQGDYSSGVTLGSLFGVEYLVLLAGNDTRFGDVAGNSYSYDITSPDAAVAAGQLLRVQANTLRAGEDVIFNGSAETDGSFLFYGGFGSDVVAGGAGNDGFIFGDGRFDASDVVFGGAGTMDQLALQGNYTSSGSGGVTFGSFQLIGVEYIVLLSAADTRFGAGGGIASYELSIEDTNVAAGQRMVIQANTLREGEYLSFFARGELDGTFQIFSGAGNDFFSAGAGADEIWGGAGNDIIYGVAGADVLRGGAGNDRFAYVFSNDSTAAARDRILDFATGDKIDFVDIAGNTGTGDFTFIGSGAPTGERQVQVIQNGNDATVNLFLDADAIADIVIDVTVTDGHTLTAADFLAVVAPAQAPLPGESADWVERDALPVMDLAVHHGYALDRLDAFGGAGALVRSGLYDGGVPDLTSLPDLVQVAGAHDLILMNATPDLLL